MKQCGILPQRVIEVLRADLDADSCKVVQLWDQLTPASRLILGMEGVALGCGITPRRLWELYNGANLMQARESIGAMIADALPRIMQVTIKDAQKPKGYASREHVYKAARVLPTPKGTVINLPGANQLPAETEDVDEDGAGALEPADDFLMKASRAMQKKLPAPVEAETDVPEGEDEQ